MILCIGSFIVNNSFLEPSIMEARNFITVREILQDGNWLIPTLNGELRLAKPPFPTWVTALSAYLAGDIYNLTALRTPAGLMGILMALSMFGLAKILTKDKYIPFLAAGVLCTSFYVLFMARRGTWDIYCHSFMLAAIWALTYGLRIKGSAFRWFCLSGCLMGLSFMSKGPVSFYVLLLPYLIAYMVVFGLNEFKVKYQEVFVGLLVCIIISSWWPVYTYFQVPEELLQSINTETGSWQNRSVKPFWHYWSFPVQSGIWTIFIVLSLLPFYAKSRVEQAGGNYRFLFLWVLLTIFLLSIMPEKKERYLMPGLISQALLVSYLLKYFILNLSLKPSKVDSILVYCTFIIVSLSCIVSPFALYHLAFNMEWIPVSQFVGFSVILTAFGVGLGYLISKKQLLGSIITMLLLVALCCVWLPVIYGHIIKNKPGRGQSIDIRSSDLSAGLNYYSLGLLRPEEIWEVGKRVRPLTDLSSLLNLPERSILLFNKTEKDITVESNSDIESVTDIGVFHHPSNPEVSWEVSILTLRAGTKRQAEDQLGVY